MKKLTVLLTVIIFSILFISCNNSDERNQFSEENLSDVSNAASVETQKPTSKSHNSYISYVELEQCVNDATDIIKGRCLGITETENRIEYEIEVVERFLGEEEIKSLLITSDFKRERMSRYENGKEYYLILVKRSNVYKNSINYSDFSGVVYIPSDDIVNAKYYGSPLVEHTDGQSICNEKELVDYLKSLIEKRDPTLDRGIGAEFLTETDMESIVKKSEFVLEIKIENFIDKSEIVDVYECKIVSILKGNVEKESNVRIFFFPDTVDVGEEYVLALTEVDNFFVFSSRNSLFSVDDINEIQEYIKE